MLSDEQVFFLRVLKDHLAENGTTVSEAEKRLDWAAIAHYADIHKVGGIVYAQCRSFLDHSGVPEAASLKTTYKGSIARSVYQSVILEQIDAAFKSDAIPYFVVKGPEIAKLYPVPELRTMGDLDIVVHREDKERAHECLLRAGFRGEKDFPNEWFYHIVYFGMDVEVELHHSLLYDSETTPRAYAEYEKTIWEHTTVSSGGGVSYGMDDHLIFLLLHLRMHILATGIGLRQFFDIAVVVKNCEIDYARVLSVLASMNAEAFAKTCFSFLYRWFGVRAGCDFEDVSDAFFDKATNQLFSNGVFGFDDPENSANHAKKLVIQQGNTKFGRVRVFLRRLFPPYALLRGSMLYRFLDGRPYLLPIAWIKRFCRSIANKTVTRSMNITKECLTVSDERIREQEQYFLNWGIDVRNL